MDGDKAREPTRRMLLRAAALAPLAWALVPRASRASSGATLSLDGAPGAAAGVVRQGKACALGGYGRASALSPLPPTGDTVFEIGSLTKTFTASVIFQLQSEGRLHIQMAVSEYVTDLPEAWRRLTLAQLLSHTSGIPNYLDESNFRAVMTKSLTPREILAMVKDPTLRFTPGERFDYSNTGFILLGMVIEAVTTRDYWDELDRRLFQPAGMVSTGPRHRLKKDSVLATGHFWNGHQFESTAPVSSSAVWSAGGLYSTARDINRWSIALDQGHVLTADECRAMWTPAPLANGNPSGWGYGWAVSNEDGGTVVSHGGGTEGFSCWYRRDLAHDVSIIVLTNQNGKADPKMMVEGLQRSRTA